MKKLIAELPMLTAPKEKEELIVYLAAAKEAVSAVLMTEGRLNKKNNSFNQYTFKPCSRGQRSLYPMESWCLPSQRQATDEKDIFKHTQLPRTAIKGQILADFIVERPEEESPNELMTEPEEVPEPWTLFTDGSSCIVGSGARLILTNPEGVEFIYAMSSRTRGRTKREIHNEKEILAVVEEEGNTWMTPICEYLTKEILSADKKKARAIRHKAVRFGLPGEIISDNGKQIRDNPFKEWCEKLCIRQCFASVKHPQINGLVERANRSLGEGIKARLDERSKDWIGELSHVLWSHRIMIKSSNGETPFSLTYGTEAVIPAEIGMPTLRTMKVDQTKNDEALEVNLDLIVENREQAAIQEAKSKTKMEKYYNYRVHGTSFKPGDMVYRSNDASHARDGGKLGPKWEGPYEV
ncbi:reverse transcriptase domain-containing protein, partial [Tanacetum coccineum]